ncbi:bifunctional non-homologous end joining protein LigD [Glycomyces lechevalierae]|uniref:DNA ligase (ATP) n=1 Tax=Glycomyces lechevalierae TaxID=256034 RepID=A0ABU2AI09_9ACTN|nr:bifunctional non-homologous end joining protein LigD [Glycomyces lechevalierae]
MRTVSAASGGLLQMRTRRGNDIPSSRFPELRDLTDAYGDIVLDGELVVFTGDLPDFGAVITRMRAASRRASALAEAHPATVLVFDLLRLDGVDLRARPYVERREILEGLALPEGWVVPPRFADGPATVAASMEHGIEGVVAKRLNSSYVSGRSRNWIKRRHEGVIDAIVIGWVRRSSGGISLLLAESAPGGLAYTGRCTAPAGLLAVLVPLAAASPAAAVPSPAGAVQWVRPQLQVEVTASSRGPDGRLRQPRFVRARLDQLE